MSGATVSGANFVDADLPEAKLIRASAAGSVVILPERDKAGRFNAAIGEVDFIITNDNEMVTYCASERRLKLYGKILRANFGATKLYHARLDQATIYRGIFCGAKLNNSFLINANLSRTKFSGAELREADLTGAKLLESDLTKSDLENACLNGVNLERSNLKNANLMGADFSDADVRAVKFNRKTKFLGARLATCYGSPKFISFARHQEYLEEMGLHCWGKIKRFFWRAIADCGRTIWNWLFWSLFLAVGFAGWFSYLNQQGNAFDIHGGLPNDFHTMLYYSVVTFTTLGFGDITPRTSEAAYWVMLEVIMGYIMLGGLISIFATKLARRF